IVFTPLLPVANVNSIVVNPTPALPPGNCTVTLESTLITDVDTTDSPNELDGNLSNDLVDGDADDFAFSFTVDAPPQVLSASVEVANVPTFIPLGGGQRADVDTNIV
ncbi:MAG TPA: hypothetical protein PLZ51_24775, partial [Aggregatilineales bacterium]|nr:hypothetical protein [Aggregatilineales bacterium]